MKQWLPILWFLFVLNSSANPILSISEQIGLEGLIEKRS
jgi:hypothetical protein